MPGWARPVRTFCISCFSASTVLPILNSAVFLISAIVRAAMMSPCARWLHVHQRALIFTLHDALQRAGLDDREHPDWQLLIAAQGERGGIHHLQIAHDRVVETDRRIP